MIATHPSPSSESEDPSNLKLMWWNTADFFHYDPAKAKSNGANRWPADMASYEEKCRRVDNALTSLFEHAGTPDILALGEITGEAAKQLRDRLLPTYECFSLDVPFNAPSLQIAVLHKTNRSDLTISESPPLVAEDVPLGTRAMAVLEVAIGSHTLQIIVCHWQPSMSAASIAYRRTLAQFVARSAYEFLRGSDGLQRSVMIVGDLNEEPFELDVNVMHSHRHRAKALAVPHYQDKYVRRVSLYNCSWRLLGEKYPHNSTTPSLGPHVAGTYYYSSDGTWHHFDQILVSAGLLGSVPPYIDEQGSEIINLPAFIPDRLPTKFSSGGGVFKGLSDHLPIMTTICTRV